MLKDGGKLKEKSGKLEGNKDNGGGGDYLNKQSQGENKLNGAGLNGGGDKLSNKPASCLTPKKQEKNEFISVADDNKNVNKKKKNTNNNNNDETSDIETICNTEEHSHTLPYNFEINCPITNFLTKQTVYNEENLVPVSNVSFERPISNINAPAQNSGKEPNEHQPIINFIPSCQNSLVVSVDEYTKYQPPTQNYCNYHPTTPNPLTLNRVKNIFKDNVYSMTNLTWWRFVKDCCLHQVFEGSNCWIILFLLFN